MNREQEIESLQTRLRELDSVSFNVWVETQEILHRLHELNAYIPVNEEMT